MDDKNTWLAFEARACRRIPNVSRTERITNAEVFQMVQEQRRMLNFIKKKAKLIGHILLHATLLKVRTTEEDPDWTI